MAATKKRKPAAKTNKKPARRADYGRPIDGFLAKRPPAQRALLEELRAMIHAAAPGVVETIKWGMPFYLLDGKRVAATPAFKAHVQILFFAPSDSLRDPDQLLEGTSADGRHLKLRDGDPLPRAQVRAWLAQAVTSSRTA